MKVLVTGGSGVVGTAAVTALVRGGHEVRLFSRHAESAARQWPQGVEPYAGDIGDAEDVLGSCEGCHAVLHIAGIVAEEGPDRTFERVNVEGTRNVVSAAEAAGVRRLVYVSSLGAERGASEYHRSKRAAEEVVKMFSGDWVIARPGNVYGPGDEVVSLLLRMVRGLPAVPVIGDGDQPFQPIWHEDLGEALRLCVERGDVARRTLELAGAETTTTDDLLDRLRVITGRSPARLPMPAVLAKLGARAAGALGITLPVDEAQITMLEEGNFLAAPEQNALTAVLHIEPTPLAEGLARLADALPEQAPEEGVGAFHHKWFWVDIEGSGYPADALFTQFRERFDNFVPIEVGAEPNSGTRLEEGATITLALPLRGNIQVRVDDIGRDSLLLVTLEGHPLAGAVRFRFEGWESRVRFTVEVWDRAATLLDLIGMRFGGDAMQNSAWQQTAERVVEVSGGRAPEGVKTRAVTLEGAEAAQAERWLRDVVNRKRRRERAAETTRTGGDAAV